MAVLLCAFFAGLGMIVSGLGGSDGPPRPTGADGAGPRPHEPLPPARPAQVRIPAVGVDAPLMATGLDEAGWVAAPPANVKNLAGWYRGATAPGANGTAIIVGHVDNRVGPAVFYNAGKLKPGTTIQIDRKDGRTAVFSVYRVRLYSVDNFPAKKVYGRNGMPELRLLTCGGKYVPGQGYEANTVVYARLTGVR
ncbi:class F sortase [Streptomyces sp. A7024]|uniref:Class F sortase n=2 Tax=Streptomyces coryli TaxID=1128680 RepID=A0A6G4TZS5_9ACTN|nr:class F sortase [Streptomyces coryli]